MVSSIKSVSIAIYKGDVEVQLPEHSDIKSIQMLNGLVHLIYQEHIGEMHLGTNASPIVMVKRNLKIITGDTPINPDTYQYLGSFQIAPFAELKHVFEKIK